MTSVQSHLPRLNGNNFWALWILGLLSCSVPQKTVQPKDPQIVRANPKEVVIGQDTIIEPKQGTKDISKDGLETKVDTISWQDISSTKTPIEDKTPETEHQDIKKLYNVKLLIPLNSDGYAAPSSSRFTHFYAGVLKALKLKKRQVCDYYLDKVCF